MAAAAASGVGSGVAITAVAKGQAGNLIRVWAVSDPAGATGASTLVEDQAVNTAYVKLKNTGPTGNITATIAEMVTAFNGGAMIDAALAADATGANTGAAFTGTLLVGGAAGDYGYDSLAHAQTGVEGSEWANLQNKVSPNGQGNVDTLEKVDGLTGRRVRVAAAAATGAQGVIRAAYNEELRRAKMGRRGSLQPMGATGANEYIV